MNVKDYLKEEITIGRIENNKYIISVYTEPFGNPSFHISNKTGDTEEVYTIKDFSLLEKKTKKSFSSKEIEEVKNWSKEKSNKEGFADKTNWQVLVLSWNLLNEKFQIKAK